MANKCRGGHQLARVYVERELALEVVSLRKHFKIGDLSATKKSSACRRVQVNPRSDRFASQMNSQGGGGVAVIPQRGNRRARPGPAMKAGFLNKKDGRIRHDVTAVSRSSVPPSARAAEVARHIDGKGEKPKANGPAPADPDEEQQEIPPPIPIFEAANPPITIAVDTTSMQLQWDPVRQLSSEMPPGLPVVPSSGTDLPKCGVEYCLETRLVSWTNAKWCLLMKS